MLSWFPPEHLSWRDRCPVCFQWEHTSHPAWRKGNKNRKHW